MKMNHLTIKLIIFSLFFGFMSCQSGGQNEANDTAKAEKPKVEETKENSTSASSETIESLKQLFENRDQYSGKKVVVKGNCVKVNNQIMGRNWVHIQDGTKDGDTPYDLTITTQEEVDVDDDLTFEGTITLNKDFGGGYTYEVIMEKANLK